MNADQVRAYVNQKWPTAALSPVAAAIGAGCASDAANAAIEFAKAQATASSKTVCSEAFAYALECISACESQDIDYDSETLSHSIECQFPELDIDECDDIAVDAIRNWKRSA